MGYATRCMGVGCGPDGERDCPESPWPEQRERVVVEADDGQRIIEEHEGQNTLQTAVYFTRWPNACEPNVNIVM